MALGEEVVLEAKLFGEDQRDGYKTSHGCQEMLGATEKDWVKKDTQLAVYYYQVVEGNLKVTHKCLGDTSITHSSFFGSFNALLGAVPKHLQELQCSPPNFSHFPCPKTFCSALDSPDHCQTQPVYPQHLQTKLSGRLFQEGGDIPR